MTGFARSSPNLAMVLLIIITAINFIDRQIMTVLVEPIRADMGFTDTEFGFLTGITFAVLYSIMAVPLAYLADRTGRVRVIALCCVIWSGFTAACGMAQSFGQMLGARMGVAIGEAGGGAPSVSLLSDLFPPEKRAIVMGLYAAAGPFGIFLGTSIGAWLSAEYGWRVAFYAVASLGVVAGPLLWLMLAEPKSVAPKTADTKPAKFTDAFRVFIENRSLTLLLVGAGVSAFVSFGMLGWLPAWLMRTKGMEMADIAGFYGPAVGVTMGVGMFAGGYLVSRIWQGKLPGYAILPGLAVTITSLGLLIAMQAPTWQIAVLLLLIPMSTATMYVASALTLVSTVCGDKASATATSILMLTIALAGQGIGPFFVGYLSDVWASFGFENGLQLALMCLVPFGFIGAFAYWRLARLLREQEYAAANA